MYVLSLNMWFQKLIRQFFFAIDKIVYNFIPAIYDLLISIARTSPISQADISDMANRIYKLLTIFMIFKVTFSLIMYVVNPDDFSDKSKGLSKLGTNIIISLALLIITPYIFSYAYQLQTIILEDNSLATLIFGENNNKTFFNTAGDDMAFIVMSPFFTPNTAQRELYDCTELVVRQNGVELFNPSCSGFDENGNKNNDDTSLAALINKNYFPEDDLKTYVAGVNSGNLGLMFRQDIALATKDNDWFIIDYKYIFSTVVGIVVVFLLITFCMDVALRSIKLAFLQLVAPIPIISYVDPKSGKDGLFKKWYQMCFKTFASLFVRLIALYFGVFIISKVADRKLVDIIDGSYVSNGLIAIFIIIGALMFAKQLPKILEGLGIKLDGDGKFFLNPLKKFEEQAIGGKNVTGMARGALVGTAGALTGAGLAAGLSGAWRGLKNGKGWTETGKATAEMNRKMRQAKLNGSTFAGRMGARVTNATGLRSQSESIEKQKNALQKEIDVIEGEKKRLEAQIAPEKTKIRNNESTSSAIKAMQDRAVSKVKEGNGAQGTTYQELLRAAEAIKNNNFGSPRLITDSLGNSYTVTNANKGAIAKEIEQRAERYANVEGRDAWLDDALSSGSDTKLTNLYSEYKTKANISGHDIKATASDLDNQSKTISTDTTNIKNNIATTEQSISNKEDEIKEKNVKMQEFNKKEKVAKANEDAIK